MKITWPAWALVSRWQSTETSFSRGPLVVCRRARHLVRQGTGEAGLAQARGALQQDVIQRLVARRAPLRGRAAGSRRPAPGRRSHRDSQGGGQDSMDAPSGCSTSGAGSRGGPGLNSSARRRSLKEKRCAWRAHHGELRRPVTGSSVEAHGLRVGGAGVPSAAALLHHSNRRFRGLWGTDRPSIGVGELQSVRRGSGDAQEASVHERMTMDAERTRDFRARSGHRCSARSRGVR